MRTDIVDEGGTIRMSLASPTEEPIIDGIQYRRVFSVPAWPSPIAKAASNAASA